MSWFDKLMPSRINTEKRRRSVPEGLWVKCEGCAAQLYRAELRRNLNVCPKCGHHHYISARERLGAFFDPNSAEEIAANLEPQDPLKFKDSKRYRDRLAQAQKATGERDALIVMAGALKSMPIVAASFEFRFMAGSMGSVVGERFARGVWYAIDHEWPFVCFAASGGARMQESLFSLLQMGKTSAALAALAEAGLPYISVMTDPTTGGVSASLAFLGDVNIAEPGALIGFAGPRVIEQTVKETLPDGFQRAEFLLEKGALDMIVDRRRARDEIAALLAKLTYRQKSHAFDSAAESPPESASPEGAEAGALGGAHGAAGAGLAGHGSRGAAAPASGETPDATDTADRGRGRKSRKARRGLTSSAPARAEAPRAAESEAGAAEEAQRARADVAGETAPEGRGAPQDRGPVPPNARPTPAGAAAPTSARGGPPPGVPGPTSPHAASQPQERPAPTQNARPDLGSPGAGSGPPQDTGVRPQEPGGRPADTASESQGAGSSAPAPSQAERYSAASPARAPAPGAEAGDAARPAAPGQPPSQADNGDTLAAEVRARGDASAEPPREAPTGEGRERAPGSSEALPRHASDDSDPSSRDS